MGTRSDIKVSDVESKLGEKKKRRLFGGRDVPINLNFPNEKGIPGYDAEFPIEEILKDTPRLMKEQAELLKEELSSTEITFEKKELIEDMVGVRHNEALVQWRFDTPECRGDGRSYKIMLHAPKAMDITWGDSYSYPLHTRGGPYWQYEKIPFSKFFHTVAGRIQDKQNRVYLDEVSSLGIVLMDRIDGEFQLELDYIGVYNDQTHFEKFAYETYTLPLWNSHGF
ncbi:Complex I intermediate-associated protein 30 [Teladorsagia circumcincta]|uniref:Complex I intermediate-associated protein 30 n=1 Tax=Teladorsagia circumcincta TaxID=45464 RepID=A0A2G9V7C4_TELCI|nr:Complex I intermediate-associated protein 30 [Teladorsagia circumcincta]